MMRHYDEIAQFERDGFTVVVDKTWEDIDPWSQLNECFDDKDQLYRDIDSGKYDWFMLRVRAMLNGHELAVKYLGGCLYEDAREVLTDGTVEDCLLEVLPEARVEALRLVRALNAALDTEAV
jgi:hypothetical protein